MSNKYIYVYQTVCEPNGKTYIGVHSTNNINDGYIGCGVYSQKDAKRQMLFHKAVNKYGYTSFRRYILSFYDTYEEALEEEKYIVNEEWVKNKLNYNTALGGRGNTTKWMDDERKAKWKENIRTKVLEWMGNGGLEILKEKSKTQKKSRKFGADNPQYGKPSHLRRKVIKYDLNNNYIETYDSLHEAAYSVNTTPGNIVSCCKGIYRICKNHIFRYEDYSNEELKELQKKLERFYLPNPKSRAIDCYEINGKFVGTFVSIVDAEKKLKIARGYIAKNLSGKVKSCKGYYFKYVK